MSMSEWAKCEVSLVKKDLNKSSKSHQDASNALYITDCLNSAYRAYKSLLKDNHSGYSFMITRDFLRRLCEGKPLTDIEDREEDWEKAFSEKGKKTYQHKRYNSLFKNIDKDGTVSFRDIKRFDYFDIDDLEYTIHPADFVTNLVEKKFPITFPYYPELEPFSVYLEIKKNEQGKTLSIAVLYCITPERQVYDMDKYFIFEQGKGFIETTKKEYSDFLTRIETQVVR